MQVGRPSKYQPEYCQRLIDHMSLGLSFESFAAVVEVNRDTLYHWTKLYREFSDAKDIARSNALLTWEKWGIAGCVGKLPKFNATGWIFNMKNRFKWTDRLETETTITAQLEAPSIKELKEAMEMDNVIDAESRELHEGDTGTAQIVDSTQGSSSS